MPANRGHTPARELFEHGIAMGRNTYMNKKNRDEAWWAMSSEERAKHRRTSMRNQLMHPMYIVDYEKETGIRLTSADKGFGNDIYRTHFSAIYEIGRIDGFE